jgi:ribonucleoside-diphosphate reductase alpha chain
MQASSGTRLFNNAWKSAEPGVLFWDTIRTRASLTATLIWVMKTVSTQSLRGDTALPYDSCRLIAINLFSYVKKPFTPEAEFDFDLFRKHVHLSQRIMDDIIDLEQEKIDAIIAKIDADPEGEEPSWWNATCGSIYGTRPAKADVPASASRPRATCLLRWASVTDQTKPRFLGKVHRTLAVEAYRSSTMMASERGAFPIYSAEREKDNPFISRLREADPEMVAEMEKNGRRNIALLTIAPTAQPA